MTFSVVVLGSSFKPTFAKAARATSLGLRVGSPDSAAAQETFRGELIVALQLRHIDWTILIEQLNQSLYHDFQQIRMTPFSSA
jgi:hypothetical protein